MNSTNSPGQALSNVRFPALTVYKGGQSVSVESADSLTVTTSRAVRDGYFSNLELIDSSGREWAIDSVEKLHGVGPFWGYNLFLNRLIRVRLQVKPTGKRYGRQEVKEIVFANFARSWDIWESRGDFEKIKEAVEKATTVEEVIRAVRG